MNRKQTDFFSSRKLYILFIFTTLLITIVGLFIDNFSLRFFTKDALIFTKGWTVTVDHNAPVLADLNDYSFECSAYKTNISLKNTIPAGIPKFSTISMPLDLSTIDVYISNKLVYSYGSELYNKGLMVGSGLHFITLPTNCSGENILIVIRPSEDGAFTRLNNIQIIDTNDVYSLFIKQQIARFFVSVFLFTFGLLLILVGISISIYARRLNVLISVGLLSVSIGLWALTSSKTNQVLQPDFAVNSIIEYMTLYFAPFAFLLYITSFYASMNKPLRLYYLYCVISMGIFNIVAAILHFTNIVHLSRSLYIFYLVCMPIIPFIIILALKPNNSSNDNNSKIFSIGSSIIIITSILDMIRHIIMKYIFVELSYDVGSLIPYGTFFFLITLIIGYDLQIYKTMSIEFEKRTFEKLAYTDALTRLGNRAKADNDILDYEKSNKDYIIISFDMNGLKKVNDTLGHDLGDKLLVTFGEILTEVFGEIGNIYRFGGDEYMVLLDDAYFEHIPLCITRLISLEESRSKDFPFEIDTSYGIARSKELKDSSQSSVYKLADNRMYEMKIATKRQRD